MARKEKKYHFIYKTTNVLSGKYYIGMHSTDNLDDGYLGSGNRIKLAIRKHGKDNFISEILEYCETREILKSREEEIVNLNEIAKVDCMNLRVGGQGGFRDEEHQKKCSEAGNIFWKSDEGRKIKSEITKNLHKDPKYKEKVKKALKGRLATFKGKLHSEETKKKMRKSKNVGSNNSQFGKCWITNEVESKKINKGDLIPEGWRLGRKMKKE